MTTFKNNTENTNLSVNNNVTFAQISFKSSPFLVEIFLYEPHTSRYLMVCHASTMMGREKDLGQRIQDLTVFVSVGLGVISLVYRESIRIFLLCMGKEERFRFDIENFARQFQGGIEIKLPFFHPFRLSVNMAVFSHIFVVPILYFTIFTFRKKQDTSIQGISIFLLLLIQIGLISIYYYRNF